MKKSIVTIVAFLLFALAGFAQGKDFVLIRLESSVRGTTVYVYNNGNVSKSGLVTYKEQEAYIKATGDLLKEYYDKGYKLVSSGKTDFYDEYILQKD